MVKIKTDKKLLTSVIVVGLLWQAVLVIALAAIPTRTINFRYAGESCIFDPVLFPSKTEYSSADYSLRIKSKSFFGASAYSFKTCIEPTKTANSKQQSVVSRSHSLFLTRGKIKINNPSEPVAKIDKNAFSKPIPTNQPIELSLDKADDISSYYVYVNDSSKKYLCDNNKDKLSCPIQKANLKQSKDYKIQIKRQVKNDRLSSLFGTNIKTVEPVSLVESTIEPGKTMFDKPKELKFKFNKKLKSQPKITIKQKDEQIETKLAFESDTVTATLDKELDRLENYEVTVEDAFGNDDSSLDEPLSINFKTSGGPKVVSNNLTKIKFNPSNAVVLNLDSETKNTPENLSNLKINIGGKPVAANIYVSDKILTIKPSSPLPRCAEFSVNITDKLENIHGVKGGNNATIKSRTLCQSVSSIGSSVGGRSITAYRFGEGSSRMLFVGTMHGSETSSMPTLNDFINDLEANPGQIPKGKSLTIIPSMNPDGVASSNRYNSNGVDLNRNFPTSNWKSDVRVAGGEIRKNNGGKKALSEPEARAIASVISAERPRAVFSHHAVGSLVVANGAGNSRSIGNTYASKAGIRLLGPGASSSTFDYQITGAFEQWLLESYGTPTLVIEHAGYYSSEYYKHKSALISMLAI